MSARPLLESELLQLQRHRYVAIPNWISREQTARLRADAVATDAVRGWDCRVGTQQSGTVRLDTSVRKSRAVALYPPPSNALGCTSTRAELIDDVNVLRDELQSCEWLNLPHIEPFQTEMNYLLYPQGGHYKRHLDTPYSAEGWVRQGRRASDGGSLSGAKLRRVVSFILYLNSGWDAANGGALRVFPAYDRGYGTAEAERDAPVEDIMPEGGTLVLLMSGDVEHLVRETHAERQCLVGWFRQLDTVRVPDLDVSSLRTLRMLDRKTTQQSCAALVESGPGGWEGQ